jgi:hypothetical protein
MTIAENTIKGLNTYSGRDACIRVACYVCLFLHGILDLTLKRVFTAETSILIAFLIEYLDTSAISHWSDSFRTLSKHFATTRLILRLFDDLPAIFNLLKCLKSQFINQSSKNQSNKTVS